MTASVRLSLLWGPIFFLGVVFRLADLATPPMHADEAVGAKITADRLEGRGYVFDPSHYHGPALTWIGAKVSAWAGKTTYVALDAFELRLVPAVAGSLVVLFPVLLTRWLGTTGSLAAGLLLATSPLLCMYSRLYIHETLLVFFSSLALLSLAWWMRSQDFRAAILGGIAVGFMAATKETFVIPVLAWILGLVFVWREINRTSLIGSLGLAVICFFGVLAAAYGNPLHFFSTYSGYETDPGHSKPLLYYLELLIWPKFHAPQWWSEGGIAILALVGGWLGWKQKNSWLKLLAVSSVVQIIIYSMISYKTPWLMAVTWMQVCALAGVGAVALVSFASIARRVFGTMAVVLLVGFQLKQARAAVFRFPSDARNPLAFVPTSTNVEPLARRLHALHERSQAYRGSRIAVVGKGYWPLPWYLRGVGEAGYYDEMPPNPGTFAVVIAMPESVEESARILSDSHQMFFNGLRHEFPITVFVRHDVRAEEVEKQ